MCIKTLDDLLQSDEYDRSRFGCSSDDSYTDPQRYVRCQEAASYGGDGSTHQEHINDWRECLANYFDDIDGDAKDAINKEIDDCEQWHDNAGSLDEQIG